MTKSHNVALMKGLSMGTIWSKFPFSIGFQLYIFNVTNPDGISEGEKPIINELGPYYYDEIQEKTNQLDHEEDDTVSYTIKNTYYFNAENSNGLTGEEEVMVPNYFAFSLINIVAREKPNVLPIIGKALDSIFNKPSNFFIKAKVKDIFFDGLPIDCTVMDLAGKAIRSELKKKNEKFGLKKIAENKYILSMFGPANGTESKARTRVHRGIKNIMDVGKVIEYNNNRNISVWDDEYCDTFNGTDGTVFHPHFDRKGRDDVVVFNPNLCRSISCHFESKTTFDGLEVLRYTTDLGTDGNNNPLHKCYCPATNGCLKKGAFDIYNRTLKPIIVTNPHFYLADEYYSNQVDGLNPDKKNHMIIIDIDPFTGTPLYTRTRVQLNMFINRINNINQIKNIPDVLLPILWIDEIIILPDFLIKKIKFAYMLLKIGRIFQYFLMSIDLGLCGFSGYKYCLLTILRNKVKATEWKNSELLNITKKKMKMNISTLQSSSTLPTID
ncbi:PREDICTED: LOW QUALITY PROTEIN: sensory neuron membrane protein 1-like [Ceratosolen solmsi marchali]|uniref:LOW QUALITY PROTEIN: sensory neuron membrane protein 1-like n=1 Tax=Ceratosolen solmsi marchali TaxID=326594 RepID=A0AAJ6YJS2_9HYME|nr:PREDICTED: LOW QUALITY PROTEIN: sensory neuron membrane protein 1-like [Ceratosolen solmsi marchali]